MNYRHAYHAGNFADVVKHVVLTRVIAYLQRKEAGLLMLDTHAGIGRYKLASIEAQKTGEAETGIKQFFATVDDLPKSTTDLAGRYIEIVDALNFN
ncbi:MAG: 23S rRNA (adenine(2030)-N(6))-methyltransferase RlmJ, partial [Pseudomonadota bacterium]